MVLDSRKKADVHKIVNASKNKTAVFDSVYIIKDKWMM